MLSSPGALLLHSEDIALSSSFIVKVDRMVGSELLDRNFTFCIFSLLDLFGFPLRKSWWATWSGVTLCEVVGLGLSQSLDNVCQPFCCCGLGRCSPPSPIVVGGSL